MDSLFLKQERLLVQTSIGIVRELMTKIHWNNRLIAIRGSRGVGKTTLMLQYIKLNYIPGSREVLYCALDSIYFSNHTLLDLAEKFYLQGGKHLFLDEVHKYPAWSKELKEVYDLYPSLRVVFSGSSLLNILNADADLSRRCLPYNMFGLSFREFLMFYKNIRFPVISLQEVLQGASDICREVNERCRPVQMFKEYLQDGYYPFFTGNREDYYMNIENVVNLILEQEMPLLCGVDPAYIRKLKALLGILASSVPYEVDITKLAGIIGLTRNSVITYLQNLNRAELLKLLYSDLASVKKMQKPDKIYLQNPNLLYAIASTSVQIGTARETFAVNQLAVNHEVEYGRTQGDFVVDHKYTFEIGGADKTFKQIADLPDSFVLADDIEYATGKKLPLWIVGMTY
ncbi:MAG: AAA family ATPase [Bacteroides sp.]|uniref:ATP-binding protein n=1 Tax=Bacteroides sp. TaxID=29523 RepID=UPI0026E090AB|nr:AAA family ATPase [Bacteroides sp.]MDO5421395.1 AAA family ATPase [Bacteroides sp.]